MKIQIRRFNVYIVFILLLTLIMVSSCSDDDDSMPTPPPTPTNIELSVMSFNIRFDNPDDGENTWNNRREACITMLKEKEADIVGIQEGLLHQVEYLDENLPEYSYLGVGREDGQTAGEYAAIFYKTESFEVVEEGTFWLSETPEVPSIGWDAALERIVTWAHLREKETQKSVYTFNTHFDHIGEQARANSAELLVAKASEIVTDTTAAVFLTGDYNGILIQPLFVPILAEYQSAQQTAPVTDNINSFNGFGGGGFSGLINIDFVFHNDKVEALEYETIDTDYGVPYISDHYPVLGRFNY